MYFMKFDFLYIRILTDSSVGEILLTDINPENGYREDRIVPTGAVRSNPSNVWYFHYISIIGFYFGENRVWSILILEMS